MKKMKVLTALLMSLAMTLPVYAAEFSEADMITVEDVGDPGDAIRVSVGEPVEVEGIGTVTLTASNYFVEYYEKAVMKVDLAVTIDNTTQEEQAYLDDFADVRLKFGDEVYGGRVYRLEPERPDQAYLTTEFLHPEVEFDEAEAVAPGERAVYTIRAILPASIVDEADNESPVVLNAAIGDTGIVFPFYF